MVDESAGQATVSLFQIESHHAGPEVGGNVGDIVALRRRNPGVAQRVDQLAHPAWADDHILVDLTDDRVARRTEPGVQRCGRPPPRPLDHADLPHGRVPLDNGARTVPAPVLDDHDLYGAPVVLRKNGSKGSLERRLTIVNGYDERDARSLCAHVVTPPGRATSV